VRSAPTGHKAINAGPVNVTDYLLVYAKDRAKLRLAPQLRVRRTYDDAYKTWIDNPGDPPAAWRFRPIARAVAEHLGHDGPDVGRQAVPDDDGHHRADAEDTDDPPAQRPGGEAGQWHDVLRGGERMAFGPVTFAHCDGRAVWRRRRVPP
jgi:hypothetical protein